MKLPRRTFLHLAASAAALPAVTRMVKAQTYPTRPVRVIIGFGPGASGDIAARVLAQALGRLLGQQFVVENRSGAGSNIATNFVAHSPKDGYTLLQGTVANTINAVITPPSRVRLRQGLRADFAVRHPAEHRGRAPVAWRAHHGRIHQARA